jgi:Asp-tRNA(Asn)/Glu-tRNA(Gln) amidotransferase A subunit family amidase
LNADANSAAALLAGFGAGDITPSGVIDGVLARIDEREPKYHAFRAVVGDTARVAAARADERWRRGDARPLEGLPFAVKDNIDTAAVLTTAGSRRFADRVPDRNATVVQRLLDAGAILIGVSSRSRRRSTNPVRWRGPSTTWS